MSVAITEALKIAAGYGSTPSVSQVAISLLAAVSAGVFGWFVNPLDRSERTDDGPQLVTGDWGKIVAIIKNA